MVTDVFNLYTQEYEDWFEKNKFAYLSEVETLRKAIPKGSGLEIGVGTGRFAQPLGVDTGVDPSENMLEIARSRGIKTLVGNGEDLPFKDDEYDFVLIAFTICFVDDPIPVLKEAKRVLKRGGRIIIGIIDRDSDLGRSYEIKKAKSKFYSNARFYTAGEIIEMLENLNFKDIGTYQTLFEFPGNLNKIDCIKEGYGKGGFVVIYGCNVK